MHLTTQRFAGSRRIATALLLPALGMGLLTACGSDAAEETPTKTPEVVETKDTTEESCIRVEELAEEYSAAYEEIDEEMDTLADEDDEAKIAFLDDVPPKFSDFADTADEIARDAENQELADGLDQVSFGITSVATIFDELTQIIKEAFDEDWDDARILAEFDKFTQEELPSDEEADNIENGIETVNEICETDFDLEP